jgi:hypothetical protein
MARSYDIYQRSRACRLEGINLVIEVDVFPYAPHVSKLVAEAEEALFRLTIELARRAELEFTIPEPAGGALH